MKTFLERITCRDLEGGRMVKFIVSLTLGAVAGRRLYLLLTIPK